MEFLLYLSPDSREIYNMISQKVRVVENAPICRKYNIMGWYNSKQNVMTFCTNEIKTTTNPKYYINETLLHESVHVAQSCKEGGGYIEPFGISKSSMLLTQRRKDDVISSVKINGEQVRHIEHEAFWMEDKPDKVRYVLQKYCF
jgi:uncharacterized protein YdeI (BOF family)